MYGTGISPPQPRPAHRGVVIALRVLFAVLPVATAGLGAWGSLLRLALVTRRRLDWALFVLLGAFGIFGFTLLVVSDDPNDWEANTGAAVLISCMFLTPVYFLVADIRWHRTGRPVPPPQPQRQPYGYGYGAGPQPGPASGPAPRLIPGPTPGPPSSPVTGPVGGAPDFARHTPYGYGAPPPATVPAAPVPAPPANPPAAPRIHQVRAELDELSDLLRREEGR